LLALPAKPRPADAADALALAICHLWRAPMTQRLAQARVEAARLGQVHRAKLAAAARQAGAVR
jgi:crossover junction endodeoxyribonuclease RuvC